MATKSGGNMTENDNMVASTEIEVLKASLAECEGELRWLKGLMVATIGFATYLVWHYS